MMKKGICNPKVDKETLKQSNQNAAMCEKEHSREYRDNTSFR